MTEKQFNGLFRGQNLYLRRTGATFVVESVYYQDGTVYIDLSNGSQFYRRVDFVEAYYLAAEVVPVAPAQFTHEINVVGTLSKTEVKDANN